MTGYQSWNTNISRTEQLVQELKAGIADLELHPDPKSLNHENIHHKMEQIQAMVAKMTANLPGTPEAKALLGHQNTLTMPQPLRTRKFHETESDQYSALQQRSTTATDQRPVTAATRQSSETAQNLKDLKIFKSDMTLDIANDSVIKSTKIRVSNELDSRDQPAQIAMASKNVAIVKQAEKSPYRLAHIVGAAADALTIEQNDKINTFIIIESGKNADEPGKTLSQVITAKVVQYMRDKASQRDSRSHYGLEHSMRKDDIDAPTTPRKVMLSLNLNDGHFRCCRALYNGISCDSDIRSKVEELIQMPADDPDLFGEYNRLLDTMLYRKMSKGAMYLVMDFLFHESLNTAPSIADKALKAIGIQSAQLDFMHDDVPISGESVNRLRHAMNSLEKYDINLMDKFEHLIPGHRPPVYARYRKIVAATPGYDGCDINLNIMSTKRLKSPSNGLERVRHEVKRTQPI